MGKINVLDKAVAEKIAAGEVVERPSSVVKELVENSFDAQATSVTVEIEHGGTSYIRVTDNGVGIMPEDVSVAFLRHATSKIKDEGDLEGISTLGFRGEALCSVSAVSRTEMLTRTANNDMGVYMVVEGGETKENRTAGCPLGTTVTVRNLFFNTPARMKFLKKDATEAAYITDICQRAALSHPEISFRYIRDGRDIFFTPGDNQLRNTVRAVFGKDISQAMLDVEEKTGIYSIKGLTGSNKLSRPNRNMQYFFVN
ncbi:MAG: DNA mismatch repair endonuclease MutL [Clostridia bacterium]|nr:DNA mismatch repair endonuclease MutL [Clostridia bacterium]